MSTNKYKEALEKIAKLMPKTNIELDSQDSWGNYDDVFSDGRTQGEHDAYKHVASIAEDALEERF